MSVIKLAKLKMSIVLVFILLCNSMQWSRRGV